MSLDDIFTKEFQAQLAAGDLFPASDEPARHGDFGLGTLDALDGAFFQPRADLARETAAAIEKVEKDPVERTLAEKQEASWPTPMPSIPYPTPPSRRRAR